MLVGDNTDQRSDVDGNRADTVTAGDSVAVSRVVTEGEEGCFHAWYRFGNVALTKATQLLL